MNKESLNEFYEADKFHQKLRERIDGHEPELSDSLWDRIEHDLNRKENTNRRVVWLVYVLSGLLLVSGGALFYLWGENQKLASNDTTVVYEEPVMNKTTPAESETAISTTPSVSDLNSETLGQGEEASITAPVSGIVPPQTPRSNNIGNSNTPSNNTTTAPPAIPDNTSDLADNSNNASQHNPEGENISLVSSDVQGEANLAENPELELGTALNTVENVKEDKGQEPTPSAEDPKKEIKVRPVIFAGVYTGFNKVNQKALSGNQEMFNRFERELVTAEYGFNFGVQFNNGLRFSSGIGSYVTGQQMQFNIREFQVTNSPIPGNQTFDSIVSGNENTLTNKEYWIEVPVMIGYQYSINKWSFNAEAGTGFNLINGFSGSSVTPSWSGFDPDGTRNAQPYKNFMSLKSKLGISYAITPYLQIGAGASFRKALNPSTKTPENEIAAIAYPERRPVSWGGRFSLTYLLR